MGLPYRYQRYNVAITSRIRDYATVVGINFVGTRELNTSAQTPEEQLEERKIEGAKEELRDATKRPENAERKPSDAKKEPKTGHDRSMEILMYPFKKPPYL